MKKILLVCALGLFALSASAQEVAKKPSFKGFVNNGFWDNWELSVGGGMNYVAYDGLGLKGQNSSGDCVGWALEGSATKWFNPVVGSRFQLIGGRLNMSDGKGGSYKNNYILPHLDAMVNLSNWIGGYREDRVYYATVFGGAGVNFIDVKNDARKGFAMDFGLLNSFRLSPRFDLNVELKAIVTPSHDMPEPIYSKYGSGDEVSQIYSATLGLTYRFNKRGWERGVPGYTAEDIKAFQDAVAAGAAATAAAEADKAKLAKQLQDSEAALAAARADADAAAKAAAEARAAAAKKSDAPATVVLYDINAATLTSKEKTRLDLMADMIKNGPKDRVYHLAGHADKQTGTPIFNQKISEKRAKAAYDYLVNKGVNPDQLTYKGYGDSANPYPVQRSNRSVVIK